jgi:predicted DsbA family dithiol-disulfide isomerase
MSKQLKIDLVSDVVCPWCIIGYKRMEQAIKELGVEEQVTVEWQPFELNPNMPKEGQLVHEHISEKYGASIEDQKESQDRMTKFGAELGFTFNYHDAMRMVNTRDAHIVLEYANGKNKQTELNLKLVSLFFSEGKDISDKTVLLNAVESIGLDKIEAEHHLKDASYKNAVVAKEMKWQNLGVSSVPTMVFNHKSALSGAQPVSVYKDVLKELLEIV